MVSELDVQPPPSTEGTQLFCCRQLEAGAMPFTVSHHSVFTTFPNLKLHMHVNSASVQAYIPTHMPASEPNCV